MLLDSEPVIEAFWRQHVSGSFAPLHGFNRLASARLRSRLSQLDVDDTVNPCDAALVAVWLLRA